MTTQITTLSNGLRVVSHHMDHLETLSLGVWVATGARHEALAEHGISHFLEHMAFKGTARRTAQAIAEEIETIGGDIVDPALQSETRTEQILDATDDERSIDDLDRRGCQPAYDTSSRGAAMVRSAAGRRCS